MSETYTPTNPAPTASEMILSGITAVSVAIIAGVTGWICSGLVL